MSSAPTDTSTPSFSAIAAAIRQASGTPRRWIPTSARPAVPACFSTISWEIRIVARRISSAVMMWRPLIRSFPASRGLPGGLTGPCRRVVDRIPQRKPRPDRLRRTAAPTRGPRAPGACRNGRCRRTWTSTRRSGGPRSMLTLGYKASAEQFGPKELLDLGIEAEEAGFDSVFVSDHFQPWRHTDGHAPNCFAWLGALAARTERITIGTSVLTPTFRYHPAVVAQALATIGCLAEGRRGVLGVGTGESLNEVPLGVEWPDQKERFARLKEAT